MITLPVSPIFGHAYEKVGADCIARWHRLLGEEVFFLTGTDEHGSKIQRKAEVAGKKPKEYVDEMVVFFKQLCEKLDISNDYFIRTTDKEHEEVVRGMLQNLHEKGFVFKAPYKGLYCVDCETFYTEKDLVEGKCPTHKKPCETVEEESYFFKMSAFQEKLLEYYEKNKGFVKPEKKRNEMLNRLKGGLRDLSVSRRNVPWGVSLPFDEDLTAFVWLDALINYLSGVGYPASKNFKKFWPADMHLIGVDICFHHSVIWPAFLMALGVDLPKTVFCHGFINTKSGDKMSKSSGTVIDPIKLAEDYSTDALRYFLLREIPFGQDGNFSEEALKQRLNNELANELGNLVNRALVMIEKKAGGKIPAAKTDAALQKKLNLKKIEELMQKFELHHTLAEIFSFVTACNQFINEKEPWNLKGKDLDAVLYSLADSIRVISILIQPFMPGTSEKINAQLGVKPGLLKDCKFNLLKEGTKVKKGEILFKKVD